MASAIDQRPLVRVRRRCVIGRRSGHVGDRDHVTRRGRRVGRWVGERLGGGGLDHRSGLGQQVVDLGGAEHAHSTTHSCAMRVSGSRSFSSARSAAVRYLDCVSAAECEYGRVTVGVEQDRPTARPEVLGRPARRRSSRTSA